MARHGRAFPSTLILRRRPPSPIGQTIVVGQVTETDLAQTITRLKQKAIGQISEADLSQVITRRKIYALGQIAEIDLSQAVGSRKANAVCQVAEGVWGRRGGWPPAGIVS